MQQNIPEAKLLQPKSRRPCGVRDQYVTRDDYACASCLRPTFRQIYLIINQSNRKYLTYAQQVTESLFITRTELKGMTEENKRNPLLSS